MFPKLLASEPVRLIFNSVGGAIGIALYAALPAEYKSLAFAVFGGIAAAGEATRKFTVSPATNLAQNAETAKAAIQELDGLQVGAPGVLPMTVEPIANRIAVEVAEKAGGAAGKLATKVAGNVFGKLGRRFNRA